jgi:hypothetical protein
MTRQLPGFLACLALAALACLTGISAEAGVLWLDEAFRAEIPGAEAVYFPMNGISEEEWRASSVLAVVAAGGPENALAWTTWGANFGWGCEAGAVVGIRVEMPIRVYLPRPRGLPLELIPEWRIYFRKLADHEAGHVRIVREHASDFDGINGTPCDEAAARVDRIYAFIGQLNRQYDGLK